jgi:hypothetical protein
MSVGQSRPAPPYHLPRPWSPGGNLRNFEFIVQPTTWLYVSTQIAESRASRQALLWCE